MVPFCPCREANLSPTCGMRTDRTCGTQRYNGMCNVYSCTVRQGPGHVAARHVTGQAGWGLDGRAGQHKHAPRCANAITHVAAGSGAAGAPPARRSAASSTLAARWVCDAGAAWRGLAQRTRILTNRCPSAPVVTSTESIMPLSLCRREVEPSCRGRVGGVGCGGVGVDKGARGAARGGSAGRRRAKVSMAGWPGPLALPRVRSMQQHQPGLETFTG